jgi:hypothetical protein
LSLAFAFCAVPKGSESRADGYQIDRAAPALGLHHRRDRRFGVLAGPQVMAVEDDERLGAVKREIGAWQLAESCAFGVQRLEQTSVRPDLR